MFGFLGAGNRFSCEVPSLDGATSLAKGIWRQCSHNFSVFIFSTELASLRNPAELALKSAGHHLDPDGISLGS